MPGLAAALKAGQAVTGREVFSSEPSERPDQTTGKGFRLGANDTKPCVGLTRVGGNLNNQSLYDDN